ncbi:bifunctional 4-hydroxy-2-oxoglutarate aldolase/2-dehydro-3-deoxy-phosphogluconate aldolase [Sediminibacterium sp.]|jgi:2-dehydro-3-deoxyphosphogluconate aldolase / (4S)-4-hydroxy-2-oxoglutarate aldolase|uniref:bifunctional 4-hydroxy-2-oxoglutarate aldolase/2-dehydro-3-deoxy-phosphogluconate aldolase n=1 Tax=Sediminibacterium sp. TaxID=1917865 RepID=UPI0025DDBDE5|nr:bifunctional 4-hydroxy-2-oxoglutarate aldolase/2-dehydro-3-deoxy-phosphogluconate aldolase [Sediminibacterium sp.]MBW0178490.1 bifunctional 4-hydroxy-2-oxoglutarate aldolase/2-dehydro-3-deoxy-phosphogluconate aldolase [Sediminibacterium sp.]
MTDTINHIIRHKLVPVFYHDNREWCLDVMNTCYKNSIRVFEFTNRGQNAFDNFIALNQFRQQYCPDMVLGAGTILDKQTAGKFIEAGTSFIVSPCFIKEVMEECKQNNIPYLPGCMTVKEIYDATVAGCKIIKIFPGEVTGPAFIKAVKAVLPGVSVMITGGVNNKNINGWFKAGTEVVGLGSDYFKNADTNKDTLLIIEAKIKEAKRLF